MFDKQGFCFDGYFFALGKDAMFFKVFVLTKGRILSSPTMSHQGDRAGTQCERRCDPKECVHESILSGSCSKVDNFENDRV